MSKISLSPHVSGTGNFTIASPNSSTDRTLTLPDNTGTILTSASNTNFPAGSVVQVVQSVLSTEVSSSSSTLVDTGLTASITPKSSSNKILVIAQLNCCGKQTNNTYLETSLLRGSTIIQRMERLAGYTNSSSANWIGSISSTYLDSPATTSSTTYKVQFKSAANLATVYINGTSGGNTGESTITLLEITA